MIADIVVVAVVFLFVWRGYNKGLLKTLIGLLSYVISIVAALLIYPVMFDALMNTELYDKILTAVSASDMLKSPALLSIPSFLTGSLSAGVAEVAAQLIIRVISFIAIMLISRIIIKLIMGMLGVLSRLPVINQFNRLGGSVIGGILGIIILYIAAAILVIFAPSLSGGRIDTEIESSTLAKEIYTNNFILDIVIPKI